MRDGQIVREMVEETLSLWRQARSGQPELESKFWPAEQAAREICLERFVAVIEAELRHSTTTPASRQRAQSRINSAFREFAKAGLGFDDTHLELLLEKGFCRIAGQLAREARHIDSRIAAADIFQASRNAWTACALQVLFGQPMHLTPAIFAYSMLYPYSDNYLDDPEVPPSSKLAFSERFRHRLQGKGVVPLDDREAIIWRLVELIESQYPRTRWPHVYTNLLNIHRAQENSICKLCAESAPPDVDVLRFSFEKGGASVLADAWLAAGSLSQEEARIAFGWGVLLQLLDDLQDIQQDLRQGHLTIFTQSRFGSEPPACTYLDEITTQTLNFASRIVSQLERMDQGRSTQGGGSDNTSLKQMMRMSSSLLPIWAAGQSASFYSTRYLAILETHSPFRLNLLTKLRNRLVACAGPLNRMFENCFGQEQQEEDGTASLILANCFRFQF